MQGMTFHKLISGVIIFNFLFLFKTEAQTNSDYDLLWRIEGNGLTEASYLFGTMHVKDSRAFNFSDSVLFSIDKCAAFAMEIHPDSMYQHLMKDERINDTSNFIKESLSKEEYKQFKNKFEKKNGYDFEKVKTKNPYYLRKLILENNFSHVDEKQTFVDAYLFGVARTLGKSVIGLENAKDHIESLSDVSDEEQEAIIPGLITEKEDLGPDYTNLLIDAYAAGRLKGIKKMLHPDFLESPTMFTRNKIMAESLIASMHKQSTFAAVGSAHLISEYSLISILESKGYTLVPVNASFTGIADNYNVDVMKMDWREFKKDELGFSVSLPGLPFVYIDQPNFRMYMFQDITTEAYYAIYAIDNRASDVEMSEEMMIKRILKRYKKNEQLRIINKRRIDKNGYSAIEVLIKDQFNNVSKIQLFSRNNILYGLSAGKTQNHLSQPTVERFFNSFKSHKIAPVKDKAWELLSDTAGAFSVLMPDKTKNTSKEVPSGLDTDPYLIHLFMGLDRSSHYNYIVAYNDLPNGYYIEDKSESFKHIYKDFSSKGTVLSAPDTIWLDGIEGRSYEVMLRDKYHTVCKVFIRGNRVYKMLRQNLSEGSQALIDDGFFASFSFKPYRNTSFEKLKAEDESFQTQKFSKIRTDIDSVLDYTSFLLQGTTIYSSNPNSGGLYCVQYYNINPYYKINNLDSFYNFYIPFFETYKDSVFSIDTVEVDGIPGRDLIIKDNVNNSFFRYRIWLDNGRLYALIAYVDKDELFSETAIYFFNSFQKLKEHKSFDIYASKSSEILTNLSSADSIEFINARGALGYYDFTAEDLSLLQEASLLEYGDDSLFSGVRGQIVELIASLTQKESPDKLKQIYLHEKSNDILKTVILTTLINWKDNKGLKLYYELLSENPPVKEVYAYKILQAFSDSLPLANDNIQLLTKLFEIEGYKVQILRICNNLLDSDSSVHRLTVLNAVPELTESVNSDFEEYLQELKKSKNSYNYSALIYQYLIFFRNTEESNYSELCLRLLGNKYVPDYLKSDAITYCIINDTKIPANILNQNLRKPDIRFDILKAWYYKDLWEKVPARYSSKEAVARLHLSQYLSLEEYVPDKITFSGTILSNDSVMYVYVLKYIYEGKSYEYLGMSGKFNKNTDDFDFSSIKSYASWQLFNKEDRKNLKKKAEAILTDFETYAY
jgi:uncharacterized protein YbaP (TraB family)